jgi:hypothetical protein
MENKYAVFVITRKILDMVAEDQFERELSDREIRYATEQIQTGHDAFMDSLREIIIESVEHYRLMDRNRKSKNKSVSYRVYWKNENVFQKDYKEVFSAKTEKDARAYVDREFLDEFVHFKITKVDRGNETEIVTIKLKKGPRQ